MHATTLQQASSTHMLSMKVATGPAYTAMLRCGSITGSMHSKAENEDLKSSGHHMQ